MQIIGRREFYVRSANGENQCVKESKKRHERRWHRLLGSSRGFIPEHIFPHTNKKKALVVGGSIICFWVKGSKDQKRIDSREQSMHFVGLFCERETVGDNARRLKSIERGGKRPQHLKLMIPKQMTDSMFFRLAPLPPFELRLSLTSALPQPPATVIRRLNMCSDILAVQYVFQLCTVDRLTSFLTIEFTPKAKFSVVGTFAGTVRRPHHAKKIHGGGFRTHRVL
jgi:hypothetical protein